MIKILLLVGSGGFIGSVLRYLVQHFMHEKFETGFPVGTLTVNILGSFVIGFIYAISEKTGVLSAEWRLFLAVGICGGFTTFSSFAYESFKMLGLEQFFFVALYMGLSLFMGLLATYLGILSIKLI
ncbi:MAG: fluoride efflux transporter CrcB [Bacteroidales bacterium]|nr:fluoride efflux transporter CrcB [Bacteroidales bacterium]MBN2757224.1 fluoride efflux transporter CrcB [Bacteroidales bacterium]